MGNKPPPVFSTNRFSSPIRGRVNKDSEAGRLELARPVSSVQSAAPGPKRPVLLAKHSKKKKIKWNASPKS